MLFLHHLESSKWNVEIVRQSGLKNEFTVNRNCQIIWRGAPIPWRTWNLFWAQSETLETCLSQWRWESTIFKRDTGLWACTMWRWVNLSLSDGSATVHFSLGLHQYALWKVIKLLCGAFIDPICASQATKIKTTIQKESLQLYFVFRRSLLCSPRQHLFDQKYRKTIFLWNILTFLKITVFYVNIFQNSTYSVAKPNFQHP